MRSTGQAPRRRGQPPPLGTAVRRLRDRPAPTVGLQRVAPKLTPALTTQGFRVSFTNLGGCSTCWATGCDRSAWSPGILRPRGSRSLSSFPRRDWRPAIGRRRPTGLRAPFQTHPRRDGCETERPDAATLRRRTLWARRLGRRQRARDLATEESAAGRFRTSRSIALLIIPTPPSCPGFRGDRGECDVVGEHR